MVTPITPTPHRPPSDIEVWGHRGASAFLPENTLASFRAAIKEGANGIESDVHITSDGVVLMFHDPTLDRTTNGKGAIRTQPWKGVIEDVRTVKEPVQPIPRFDELISLIMEPENQHVILNIDCKVQNNPDQMFPEMARIISSHDDWETRLAPRLILGLWHPIFIRPALVHLPLLRRYHIGISPRLARTYFWEACEGFSIKFSMLIGTEGQAFIKECAAAGKEVCVWTVNEPNEMRTAMTWGIQAILTDKVAALVALKNEIIADPAKLAISGISGYLFPWSRWDYYSATHTWFQRTQLDTLRTVCYQPGELVRPDISDLLMPDGPHLPQKADGGAQFGASFVQDDADKQQHNGVEPELEPKVETATAADVHDIPHASPPPAIPVSPVIGVTA